MVSFVLTENQSAEEKGDVLRLGDKQHFNGMEDEAENEKQWNVGLVHLKEDRC